jgi:hypothetical protein
MTTGTSVPGSDQGTDGAQATAQQAAAQAQEKAQEAVSQAKGQLREQLDQRSSQAAEQINQQASDLRSVGESLRQQGKDGPAQVADRFAGYIEKVGGYLRDKDSNALLADAEDFGRRQPWAVGAAALTLGFAAARFLRASSRDRYSARYGGTSSPSYGGSPRRSNVGTGQPNHPAGAPRTDPYPAQPVAAPPEIAPGVSPGLSRSA